MIKVVYAISSDSLFPQSDVGFPKGNSPEEFLYHMFVFIQEGAAKIANPPPWPAFSPGDLRIIAAIQEAVLIEQRVRQGERTISAPADTLRKDVWGRLRAGQGLAAISDASIEPMAGRALPARAETLCLSREQAASASVRACDIVEIRICGDAPGYEAAAALLSVLAYPDDLEARERFKDAYCQHAIRGLAKSLAWANSRQLMRPQCLLETENRAHTAYRRGMKAINSQRMIAARMLAPTLRVVADIADAKPLADYPAKTSRALLCEVAAESEEYTGDKTELNESNFIHRRWSPSRSVLHLAVAIAGGSTRYSPIEESDPHSRFDKPELVEAVAVRAEQIRQVVAGIAGIDPESMTRVKVKRY
jgi:hypothetical protein